MATTSVLMSKSAGAHLLLRARDAGDYEVFPIVLNAIQERVLCEDIAEVTSI